MFLQDVEFLRDEVQNWSQYPFNIKSLSHMRQISFDSKVTFFVGENGSGKSTLIEAIAIALGFNAEGGTKNFSFSTRRSHSNLHEFLKLQLSLKRPKDGFFLRAESFYNFASNVDELNKIGRIPLLNSYGGTSLHEQSHGESFLSLISHRFSGNGIYILDEPEAALSPVGQMSLLTHIKRLVEKGSQFIIATHSPILLSFPGADIFQATGDGFQRTPYNETDLFVVTKSFLENPERMLNELFKDFDI